MAFELQRHTRLLIFFGFADGQEVQACIAQLPRRENLEILVVDPDDSHSDSAQRIRSQLEQDSVFFWIGKNLNEVDALTKSFFQQGARATYISAIQVYAHSTQAELHLDYFQRCQEVFNQAIDFAAGQFGNSIEDAWIGVENLISNLDLISSFPGVAHLRDYQKGRPVICVASGPSLPGSFDFLRKHQKDFVIIAADSAAKPLLDQGIQPDFITAIERSELVTQMFEMLPKDCGATLLVLPFVFRKSLESFPGPVNVCFRKGPWAELLGVPDELSFEIGPSCAHLSYRMAQWMGASSIVLIGQDLAYSKTGQSHAEGTGFAKREQRHSQNELLSRTDRNYFLIEASDGSQVVTEEFLNLFRIYFEELIQKSKVRTINTALVGAKIRGATLMNFEDLEKELFPLKSLKEKTSNKTKASCERVFVAKALQEQEAVFREFLEFVETARAEVQGLRGLSDNSARSFVAKFEENFAEKVNHSQQFRALLLQVLMPKIFQIEIEKNKISQDLNEESAYLVALIDLYERYLDDLSAWTKKLIHLFRAKNL